MHVKTDIAVLSISGFSRVETHANQDSASLGPVVFAQLALGINGGAHGFNSTGKNREKGISIDALFCPTVSIDGRSQDLEMRGKHIGVFITKTLKQIGASLDVCEQKGDGSRRAIGHS